MKHLFQFIAVITLSLFVTQMASANDSCYSKFQAEAEQGIRIHSELMVIGLNCQHMAKRHNVDLYGKYRKITQRHADLLALYEDALMKFYADRGDQKPEASLNTLRTGFANKISHDAAAMRPDIFCGTYAKRINKVFDMEEEKLRKWASTFYDSHPVSYPLCEG